MGGDSNHDRVGDFTSFGKDSEERERHARAKREVCRLPAQPGRASWARGRSVGMGARSLQRRLLPDHCLILCRSRCPLRRHWRYGPPPHCSAGALRPRQPPPLAAHSLVPWAHARTITTCPLTAHVQSSRYANNKLLGAGAPYLCGDRKEFVWFESCMCRLILLVKLSSCTPHACHSPPRTCLVSAKHNRTKKL